MECEHLQLVELEELLACRDHLLFELERAVRRLERRDGIDAADLVWVGVRVRVRLRLRYRCGRPG
jgi:hypothetical protein